MVDTYPYLVMTKEAVIDTNLFKSVKIGLEKGADKAINCPFARVILEDIEYKGVVSSLVVQVLIAYDTKNDLEKLYSEFLTSSNKVINSLFKMPCKVELLSTITDEDRLANLKAGIVRFKIAGLIDRQ